MDVTSFFTGVFASLIAAEIYLWLPTLALWLQQKLEKIQESRGTNRFRQWQQTADHTPGAISKVILLLGVLAVLSTSGGTGITKRQPSGEHFRELRLVPRLVCSVLLMVMVVEVAFILRFEGADFEQKRTIPTMVMMIPLQLLSLWITGVKDPFIVRSLRDLRILVLAFVGALIPIFFFLACARSSFFAIGMLPSVVLINTVLAILIFGGIGLFRRILHETSHALPQE